MAEITIYAELNRKQFDLISQGDISIEVPNGVQMSHKNGSRSLYFLCNGGDSLDELVDALDADGINWQEM